MLKKPHQFPLVIAGLLLIGFSDYVKSEIDNKSFKVSLTVRSNLELKIPDDEAKGFRFESIPSDEKASDLVRLGVTANRDEPWAIAVKADPLTHADGETTIDPSGFSCWIESGQDEQGFVSGEVLVPQTPTTIYTADPNDYNTSDLDLGFGIKIKAPKDQKAGPYSTTISIVLVDPL